MSGRLPVALQTYRLLSAAATPVVPLFLAERKRRGKEHAERIGERRGIATVARPRGGLVWVHGASVGELASVLPLIERITEREVNVLVTTGTVTSGDVAEQRLPAGALHQFAPLDVPIYVHPAYPHPAVLDAYYKDYIGQYPTLASAGWGFTVETATQGIRFVLSGLFDKYPKLQIILGHLGEGLPFYLWRINQALARPGNTGDVKSFREVFCEHFYITTSGFFSDPALQCCITELGIDRIMFSVDYPFVENPPGTEWINALTLNAADKAKILSGNARRLLKL